MTTLQRRPGGRANVDAGAPVYRLDIMTQDDVPDVSRVERRYFASPWPTSAYRRELQNLDQNHYVVLREIHHSAAPSTVHDRVSPELDKANGATSAVKSVPRRSLLPMGLGRRPESNGTARVSVIGFAGMWLAFDEAHVTTIGVDPLHRGQGLGELLLLCMFDAAIARGANWLTLEVRITNTAAQALYKKYGFATHGTRKRYYSDNNEDALIMWSRALSELEYRANIESRRCSLARRLAGRVEVGDFSPFANPTSRAGTP